MDVPVARRVGRPAWLNARTALGVALFCLAFLGGQRVLQEGRQTVRAWTAAHDLAAGTTLQAADLISIEVKLPSDLAGRYVLSESALEGAVVTRAARAGELISSEWLATGAQKATGSSISVPVNPEHAVGGELRPGDRIDVLATFDAQDVRARTTAVVRAAEVLDVVESGGLVVSEEAAVGVTVAVSPKQATALAFAIRTADIDIVRVDGAKGSSAPAPVTARSFP